MNSKNKILNNKYLILLFTVAFLERTLFDLGPNIELVTMVMVLASFYLGYKQSFWLTFAIMAFTDRVIGNSNIFLFTWSGFLIPSLVLSKLFRNSKLKIKGLPMKVAGLTSTGLLSNLYFFVHTNFGVWLLSSMYPQTFSGLLQSYINALPFLRNQALSTILFIPLGYILTEFTLFLEKKYKFTDKLTFRLSPKS